MPCTVIYQCFTTLYHFLHICIMVSVYKQKERIESQLIIFIIS